MTGCELIQQHAGGEDVALRTDRFTQYLFRRKILKSARDDPRSSSHVRSRPLFRFDQLCETEIEYLHDAVRPDHHVVWLDVAMHNAGGVCGPQCRTYLDGDVEQSLSIERTF